MDWRATLCMVNMSGQPKYTKDGLETTIGISFFGHFLLTELLLDVLEGEVRRPECSFCHR